MNKQVEPFNMVSIRRNIENSLRRRQVWAWVVSLETDASFTATDAEWELARIFPDYCRGSATQRHLPRLARLKLLDHPKIDRSEHFSRPYTKLESPHWQQLEQILKEQGMEFPLAVPEPPFVPHQLPIDGFPDLT